MPDDPTTGPRLDDMEFFTTLLDRSQPALDEAAAAADRGNLAEARRLFAAEVRASLRPDRFLRIRRSFTEPGAHIRPGETAAEVAERVLAGELISAGTPMRFDGDVDWTANPTHNQYREWTWQLSRHPEWGILAERYRETGDERFAEAFVRLFRSWVRQAVAPGDVPGNETKCWRTIEAGIRMGGAWPWALHSFYRSPAFTDDDLVDFYKSLWEHGRRLRHNHRTHNWLIMEMNGLGQIGVLYPQLRDAPAWKAYAFDRLVEEMTAQVYPDGLQYELSTNYHQVNIRNYEWLWAVCEAYDEPVPDAFATGLEKMHAANVRLAMPDGRLPDLNDGRWNAVAPLLRGAIDRFPQREDFRWAASGGAEGSPPAETSHAFGYAGYYVMRTGWEPDAVWVMVDAGPFGAAHQHEDKLNVLLHAYGRLLLTEGGNYAYDDSEMRRYVLSTRGHNTVRVDGLDQNRRRRFRREDIDITTPAGASWRTGDRLDVVDATYDEGYGPDAEHVATHRRTVVLDKSSADGLGPYAIVVDRLRPADDASHRYEALWHLNTDTWDTDTADADDLTVTSRDPGQPNLAILAAGPGNLQAHVVSGQESPEWQGWKSIRNHLQGEYAPAPTAVYAWEGAGPTRVVTVLYPATAGADCPIRAVRASADIEATTVSLQLTDGRELELNEGETR